MGAVTKNVVEKALTKLKRGDLVKVCWMDASESEVPNLGETLIPNHNVETRVEEYGEFVGVQLGKFSKEPHLIYIVKRVDKRPRLSSVPLKLVYHIAACKEKTIRKACLSTDKTSSVDFRRDVVQRFGDGSVKYRRPQELKRVAEVT